MGRRPAGLPPLRGRGWSDQPATVKRSQGDVEAALADAEPVGQLGGGDGPRMAGPDGVENRLLTLAESVVFGTAHARPSLAGLDTRRHAPRAGSVGLSLRRPRSTVNWLFAAGGNR